MIDFYNSLFKMVEQAIQQQAQQPEADRNVLEENLVSQIETLTQAYKEALLGGSSKKTPEEIRVIKLDMIRYIVISFQIFRA